MMAPNVAWEREYACGHRRVYASPGDPSDEHCTPGGQWVGARALVYRDALESLQADEEVERMDGGIKARCTCARCAGPGYFGTDDVCKALVPPPQEGTEPDGWLGWLVDEKGERVTYPFLVESVEELRRLRHTTVPDRYGWRHVYRPFYFRAPPPSPVGSEEVEEADRLYAELLLDLMKAALDRAEDVYGYRRTDDLKGAPEKIRSTLRSLAQEVEKLRRDRELVVETAVRFRTDALSQRVRDLEKALFEIRDGGTYGQWFVVKAREALGDANLRRLRTHQEDGGEG